MSMATVSYLKRDDGAGAGPSIPLPPRRWFTRIGLPAAIVLLTFGLLAFAARDALLPATQVTIVRAVGKAAAHDATAVGATAPDTSTAAVIVQAPGWVEPDPFPIRIPALTEGVVKEMLVLEGGEVHPGQVVARLIDDDAKLALRRAEAEMMRRKAMLEATQAQWDNPIEQRRAVTAARAEAAEVAAELAHVDARILAEAAKTAEFQSLLNRMQNLPGSFVSEFELERAKLQLDGQKATAFAQGKQRSMIEAKADRAAGELLAAQENLRLRIVEKQALEEAKAQHQDAVAAFDEATLRLNRMEIRAEVGGIVMVRHASPGLRMMTTGDAADTAYVVDLYDPRKLQVRTDVPLGDAAKIGVGQRAQIVVDVLPDRVFTGHITRLVHQADIGKNTIQVKVAIDDPALQIKPEMLARVKFLAASTAGDSSSTTKQIAASAISTFVPKKQVVSNAGGSAIWMIDATRQVATLRPITPGTVTQDDWIEVVSGVNPNDAIITHPQNLREGERVKIAGESQAK